MKNTLALACLAVLAFPLWVAADATPSLPSDDAALYAIVKNDTNVADNFNTRVQQWGEYNEKNAAEWHKFLDAYRRAATRPSVALKPGQTVTDIQKACNNGKLMDGTACQDSTAPVVPDKKPKPGEKKTGTGTASAGANIDTNNTAKANLTTAGTPPHGETPTKPEEKKDPNKWNDTIAGGKMAIVAALIGFVFGGPIGMMTFAMVGFGAGYFMHKMS